MPDTAFYFDLLRKSDRIRKDILENKKNIPDEAENTYALIFASLVRSGISSRINYHKNETFDKKKTKATDILFEEVEEEDPMKNAMAEIKDENGTTYAIKPELLKKIMGDDFSKYIVIETNSGEEEPETEQKPDINEEIKLFFGSEIDGKDEIKKSGEEKPKEGEIKKEPEAEKKEMDDSKTEDKDIRLPELPVDSSYENDKQGIKDENSFIYDIHKIRCTSKGKEIAIDVYVYPLSVKENERAEDIFVAASKGTQIRAAVSKGKTSSLRLDIDTVSVICRGRWENGEFISQVTAINGIDKDSQTEKVKKVRRTTFTSTTYFRAELKNAVLAVFPASKKGKNDDSLGTAPSALLIRQENEIKILTPTAEGTFRIGNLSIEPYWLPGAFHVDINTI